MRVGLAAALVLLTVAPADAETAARKIEIVRPASKGAMNSVPAVITLRGAPKGTACQEVVRAPENRALTGGKATVLLGGDRVVCPVVPDGTIEAFTPRAMRPSGFTPDAGAWDATRLTLRKTTSTGQVTLLPKTKGSTFLGGWRFSEPAATKRLAGP